MPYNKKVFVIDQPNRRYVIYRGHRETVVAWKHQHTAAHLAHMAGLMRQLKYRVIVAKPAPKGVTHMNPPQAAKHLGVTTSSIYSRIKYKTIAYERVPDHTTKTGYTYRIPVESLTRFKS